MILSFKKRAATAMLLIALLFAPPVARAQGVVLLILAVAFVVVDAVSCDVNVLWGCSGGGDGGGGGSTGGGSAQTPCTSGANACGMTNTGFLSGGSCSASAPPNSSCPVPAINPNDFTANPSTIAPAGQNGSGGSGGSGSSNAGQTTLSWKSTNTTDCTITGDNGFSTSGGASGSVLVTGLVQSTVFTLTCEDGAGGPTASRSLRVLIDPHYKEI